jgi:hypothetical protein
MEPEPELMGIFHEVYTSLTVADETTYRVKHYKGITDYYIAAT